MNCPNCGSEIFADQQYCRSCGTELISLSSRRFNAQAWGLAVLMMIFGGLLVAMAGKLWELKWLTFTGLIIMFGGIFCVAAYALFQQTRPRKSKQVPPPSPNSEVLLRADPTNQLLPIGDNDFIPSVVDDTTELLRTPTASRSKSHD